ncbi:MAG: hypothetical protein H8D97_00875 [Proteobacteria bacterium]|nr:hypothetical protein [Pseudomonadota bacterium]
MLEVLRKNMCGYILLPGGLALSTFRPYFRGDDGYGIKLSLSSKPGDKIVGSEYIADFLEYIDDSEIQFILEEKVLLNV